MHQHREPGPSPDTAESLLTAVAITERHSPCYYSFHRAGPCTPPQPRVTRLGPLRRAWSPPPRASCILVLLVRPAPPQAPAGRPKPPLPRGRLAPEPGRAVAAAASNDAQRGHHNPVQAAPRCTGRACSFSPHHRHDQNRPGPLRAHPCRARPSLGRAPRLARRDRRRRSRAPANAAPKTRRRQPSAPPAGLLPMQPPTLPSSARISRLPRRPASRTHQRRADPRRIPVPGPAPDRLGRCYALRQPEGPLNPRITPCTGTTNHRKFSSKRI